jgi:ABC-type branched-subunit amino acid transport system permease subunit
LPQGPLPGRVHEAILASAVETQRWGTTALRWRFRLAIAACLALMSTGVILVAVLQEAIESPFATELHALREDTRSAARFLGVCAGMDVPATAEAGPGGG